MLLFNYSLNEYTENKYMPRQQTPLSLEYILLGFLEQKSSYGYDLYKQINTFEPISLIWSIKQSQLYALLDRLEEDQLITSTLIPGESRPNRKQYTITSVGRQTFYAWLKSPVQHEREIRIEFLAKIYFAVRTGPDLLVDLIEDQKVLCFDWINQVQNDLLNTVENQVYERIVYQYRIRHIQATLDWLEAVRAEIGLQTRSVIESNSKL